MLKRSAVVASLALAACGGGSGYSSGPPTSPTGPAATATVVIGTDGVVSPTEVVIAPGARVLFINNHNRPHNMASDPHPAHTDCPAINQVGLLAAGQQRETGSLNTVRTCGFHDHDDDQNNGLRGRIVVR